MTGCDGLSVQRVHLVRLWGGRFRGEQDQDHDAEERERQKATVLQSETPTRPQESQEKITDGVTEENTPQPVKTNDPSASQLSFRYNVILL